MSAALWRWEARIASAYRATDAKGFDPKEPRDADGKWTISGGGDDLHQAVAKKLKGREGFLKTPFNLADPLTDEAARLEHDAHLQGKRTTQESVLGVNDPDVRASQGNVSSSRVLGVAFKSDWSQAKSDHPVTFVAVHGKKVIVDGHHRMAAAKWGGATHVVAHEIVTAAEPDEADDAGILPAKKQGGGADNPDLKHRREVIKVCKRVARQYGFPPDKIEYDDGGHSFNLTGKREQAHAVTDLETGVITVFPARSGLPEDAGDVLAHEIAHVIFESVDQAREREYAQMTAAGDFSKLWTDAGDLEPEFHREYPVHSEIARFSIRLKDDLATEDGVTPYSTRWWHDYARGEVSRHIAEHETFAEIGRVTHQSRASHGGPWHSQEAKQVTPLWRAYFQAVQRAYKKMNK